MLWKQCSLHCLPCLTIDILWWRNTSHLAKLATAHPSIPTVHLRETSLLKVACGLFRHQSTFSTSSQVHSCYRRGYWSDMSVHQHLISNNHYFKCSKVFSSIFWWVIWYTSGIILLRSAALSLILSGIQFSRIRMKGKLSRWPLVCNSHISFQNVHSPSCATIYLGRQSTSLLISAQLLWSVKQKNNQRLLQRPDLLTATESKSYYIHAQSQSWRMFLYENWLH